MENGGYPPLILGIKFGFFYIMSRSDKRKFKDKGGCGLSEARFVGDELDCDEKTLEFKVLWRHKIRSKITGIFRNNFGIKLSIIV
jgi:hypothetical protein